MQPCGGQLACLFADEPAFRAHVCVSIWKAQILH